MPNIGTGEIILLLLVALLLFGAKRLPEIGRSLGRGMREFKESVTGSDEPEPIREPAPIRELEYADDEPDETPAATPARERDTVA